MPFHRVVRVGGQSTANNPRFDLSTIAVDSFAAKRTDAEAAAREADDVLREVLPGTTTAGAVITRVETVTGPHWAPWDDSTVRRFTATYRLHVKRRDGTYAGIEAALVPWLDGELTGTVAVETPPNLADLV